MERPRRLHCFSDRADASILLPTNVSRLILRSSQVYRGDGETVRLPDGTTRWNSRVDRNRLSKRALLPSPAIGDRLIPGEALDRPFQIGWWSEIITSMPQAVLIIPSRRRGRAAGHDAPLLGEDLKVGCNLTWGPCFDFQKQFSAARSIACLSILTCCV